MKRNQNFTLLRIGLSVLLALAVPTALSARDGAKLSGNMVNTNVDADATAKVKAKFGKSSKLAIKAAGLAPGATYELCVNGSARASFTTSSAGKGKVQFGTKKAPFLDFDPRGEELTVSDGANDVLRMTFDGEGEPADVKVSEKASLTPTALAPGASGEAKFQAKKGEQNFEVKIKRVPPGMYELFVGGLLRGTLDASSGKGEIEFSSELGGDELLLDFDPRGEVLDIVQGGRVYLSGEMRAAAPKVTDCEPSDSKASFPLDSGGKAEFRLRTNRDCRKSFEVEIEEAMAGDYDLLVGGTLRGTISVSAEDGEGEIEFKEDSDDPDEFPLDFSPLGAVVEIVKDTVTVLSLTFDEDIFIRGDCAEQELSIENALTGPFTRAEAKVEAEYEVEEDCEMSFEVELENVDPGDYNLLVDGVNRGTITVVDDGGETEGEIEFESGDDEGDPTLDFDPTGATIEITRDTTSLISFLFDGDLNGFEECAGTASETELPLFNLGVQTNAEGEVEIKTKEDCEESFSVEIEDVTAGDYDVHVGGVLRGTISVVDMGGEFEGEIEFETDPDAGEFLLDFDVAGQLVEVKLSGETILSREF